MKGKHQIFRKTGVINLVIPLSPQEYLLESVRLPSNKSLVPCREVWYAPQDGEACQQK